MEVDKHSAAAGFRIISEIKETNESARYINTFDLSKKQPKWSPARNPRDGIVERSRAESILNSQNEIKKKRTGWSVA